MFEWDDLRYLLAIERAGTLSSAARQLNVSHTTVGRRLAMIEHALGTKVFHRRGAHYIRTDSGKIVLERASTIERDIKSLLLAAHDRDETLSGMVRLAAPLALTVSFVMPHLSEFCRLYPAIRLEVNGELNTFSMAKGDADVGLRISQPVSDDFDIRKIADFGFALYGDRSALATNGADLASTRLEDLPYVAYGEEFADLVEERWLRKLFKNAPPRLRSNAINVLVKAAEAGMGVAALPCYLGDRVASLQRLSGAAPVLREKLYLVTHREQRHVRRIRVLVDHLARVAANDQALLSGLEPK